MEVEVIDFTKGQISALNDQRNFVAVERAKGLYRVNDGIYDFTFTEAEVREGIWIKERTVYNG